MTDTSIPQKEVKKKAPGSKHHAELLMNTQGGAVVEGALITLADVLLHQGGERVSAHRGRRGVACATAAIQDRIDPIVVEPDVLRLATVDAEGTFLRDDQGPELIQVDPRPHTVRGQDRDQTVAPADDEQVHLAGVQQGAGDTGVVRLDQHAALITPVGLEGELLRTVQQSQGFRLGLLVGRITLPEHFPPPAGFAEKLVIGGAHKQQVPDVAGHAPGGLVPTQITDQLLDVGMATIQRNRQLLADGTAVHIDDPEDPRDDGLGRVALLVHLTQDPDHAVRQSLQTAGLVVVVAQIDERHQTMTADAQSLRSDLRRGSLAHALVLVGTDVDQEVAIALPLIDLTLLRLEFTQQDEVQLLQLLTGEPAEQVESNDLVEDRAGGNNNASKPLHVILLLHEVGATCVPVIRNVSCFQGTGLLV